MTTLFKNAKLLTRGGAQVFSGSLGVSGDRIAFVGECPAGFEADTIIDCGGDLLMPGFVNAHTHLAMTLFRGAADDLPLHEWLNNRIWPMENKLDRDACYWGCMLAAAEMIRFGVTSSNDMYFFSEAVVRAIDETGLRALICRAVITASGKNKLYMLDESEALFHEFNGAANGRITMCLGPHAEYTCDTETLQAVADRADKLDARIHVHVSETAFEHEDCKKRHTLTPVALFDKLGLLNARAMLAHCVHVDEDDIALISKRGASVLHCPQSNLKLASGIAPVPAMLKAGINIALGTDGAASNNNLNMFEELQLAALLHKGASHNAEAVSTAEALAIATENGAKALGIDAGILGENMKADIILVSTRGAHWQPQNNLAAHAVYSASASDVRLTMVNGKLLYKDGEYLTLDIERIYHKTNEIAARLIV
jgi:5-methylthioadenosine/S-adenosylhomocysteine deaminase